VDSVQCMNSTATTHQLWLCCAFTALCCIFPAAIYMLILLYMFVGVALASDKFMASIEVRGGSSSAQCACSATDVLLPGSRGW
jgi:hypothetical protein